MTRASYRVTVYRAVLRALVCRVLVVFPRRRHRGTLCAVVPQKMQKLQNVFVRVYKHKKQSSACPINIQESATANINTLTPHSKNDPSNNQLRKYRKKQ